MAVTIKMVSPFFRKFSPYFILFSAAIFATLTHSQTYNDRRNYDEYDRNVVRDHHKHLRHNNNGDRQVPVYESSYFDRNRNQKQQQQDLQQRQTPVRNRFDWTSTSEDRSHRYEWPPRNYLSTLGTSTTTTTIRPRWPESSSSGSQSKSEHTRTYSISRGTAYSPDSRHVPGPYSWYNRTYHWTPDGRPRGYDADLDGTTLPPPEDDDDNRTYDEEEWDGRDFRSPPFDDRHPLAIYPGAKCDEFQACYPATGNLLIGREHRLKASSTCGLRQAVRYCVVSHLKEKKKCFYCDSREKFNGTARYHGIQNVVSRIGKKRRQFWWQAENGKENVTIQLDLEAEFHFTHLVITFKTFRPAAMIIERSHDFGRSWHVYQYFASDCAKSFPGVQTGARNRITDVICDSQYSGVEPSTEGEVIFRVLPPNIRVDDPYKKEVQDMLKITNLRILLVELHNLGDNLLDPRQEIKEKYYFSIYDMVVRGSCSCYGHASRCIPDGDASIPDMVYGRCECTHHTKGLNCELCEDLYNDLEWRPALGRQTNACKKCNCNNHASRCHFDRAVFSASNNASGGVCDDCQHHTMGHNCERCKPFYYRDPQRSLEDPYVCQQCDCDPRGSEQNGLCDEFTDLETGMEAGKCHCRGNVEGRRCDHCKPGFWELDELNPDGCKPCSCNKLGTVGNLGCNVNSGECVCKRNVVGRDCNRCAPHYYGLSADEEGCKHCDCDPGGSYSPDCDQESGQCQCRPHVTGRRCDQPEAGYYVPLLDARTYEGEDAKIVSGAAKPLPRQPYGDRILSWGGPGFVQMSPRSSIEFIVDDIPESKLFDIAIRYEPQISGEWENAHLIIKRPNGVDPYGPCANYTFSGGATDSRRITLSSTQRHAVVESICLEKNARHIVQLDLNDFRPNDVSGPPLEGVAPSILIDSIVCLPRPDDIPFFVGSPENERLREEFDRFRCYPTYYSLNRSPEPDAYCRSLLKSVGFYVFNGAHPCDCDPTGSLSTECGQLGGQCPCKTNVAERTCSRCHIGYFGFGPDGCKACDCHGYGSLDNFCDKQSGQCSCRTGTYGRACDECQPGYWNYPNCQRCSCNGLSDLCDSKTGNCVNCRDNTAGASCDVCADGYYGDPIGRLTGTPVPCRQCPCPGVEGIGVSHAATCALDSRTQNVICHCKAGYAGERCDRCDHNYWGDPITGDCVECECNRNIDISQAGNCDAKSGECLRCLYHTGGAHCDVCQPGYFGDALEHSCAQCVCHDLGTDPRSAFCDAKTGQCACLPNVEGRSCDRCAPNHFNLTSGSGCAACDCDPQGSHSMKCNEIDGQCHCKPTFGGRRCDECLPNHWGDPRVHCRQCECHTSGSLSNQCDKTTGYCVCAPGISGPRCDRCARGFNGTAPHCETCGECFENWDLIIQKLKNETLGLLDKARIIKQTGTTGAYTKQFTIIEESLNEVDKILQGQDINEMDLDQVEHMIDEARGRLNELQNVLGIHEKQIEDTKSQIIKTNAKLDFLTTQAATLKIETEKLKESATQLQEANVEGAYNITKDSRRRSQVAKNRVQEAGNILRESENIRRNTENLIDQVRDKHNLTYFDNERALDAVSAEIRSMENGLSQINHLVCDGNSTMDKCDNLCGGAGCGRCGGVSCTAGATTKSSTALSMAENANAALKEKDRVVKNDLRRIAEARQKADEALAEAREAFRLIGEARNASQDTADQVSELLAQIDDFLQESATTPAMVRTVAERCVNLKMSLDPKEIEALAFEIAQTIAGLKNIAQIIDETKESVSLANNLKINAERAKQASNDILAEAESVRLALQEAAKAQEEARNSIDAANRDISSIDRDLQEIDRGIDPAQKSAKDAEDGINDLNRRIDDLKKRSTSNNLKIESAQQESKNAANFAEQASRGADELEKKYQQAAAKMDQKSQVSDTLKKRANDLRQNASQLFTSIATKLKNIEDYEMTIQNNEDKLKALQKKVDELNKTMKNHLNHIEDRAKHYRECQA